jgi:hypothetical protein
MLVMPAPVPPTGNLKEPPQTCGFPDRFSADRPWICVHHELDVVTGGEAQVAVAVLVGDFADFADVGGALIRRAPPQRTV